MTIIETPPQVATDPDIYLDEHQECDSLFVGYNIYYLSNHLGKLRIAACMKCDYEFVKCLHIKNVVTTPKLNPKEGYAMKCLLCGEGI